MGERGWASLLGAAALALAAFGCGWHVSGCRSCRCGCIAAAGAGEREHAGDDVAEAGAEARHAAAAREAIGRRQAVCVFLGSSKGVDPAYMRAAESLGRLLAARDVALVYGGGSVGLMGALSRACVAAGGTVVGVIPRALMSKELAGSSHGDITEVVVESMHERKALMASLADAFIALPGGLGTLEEALEAATWTQIGVHRKAVGLLNVLGFWDGFTGFLAHSSAQGFLPKDRLGIFLLGADDAALLDKVLDHTPPEGYSQAWKKV